MLKTICPLVLLVAFAACGGVSEVAGRRLDDAGDGEPSPVDGDEDGADGTPDEDAGTDEPPEDAGGGAEIVGANIVLAANDQFDSYFTDADGRPLYMLVTDAAGSERTSCAGEVCAQEWPAFDVEEPLAGRGIDQNELARFLRIDGTYQVTYKGRPLYYHTGDKPNDVVTGDSVDENGDVSNDGTARFYVARDYLAFLYRDNSVKPAGTQLFAIPFLVDGRGRTLYVYLTDTQGVAGGAPTSSCLGDDCKMKWPVWSPSLEAPILPTGISADTLSVFDRETGEKQAAFRGWPLYYFNLDDEPGEVAGHNLNEWRAIYPNAFATAGNAN